MGVWVAVGVEVWVAEGLGLRLGVDDDVCVLDTVAVVEGEGDGVVVPDWVPVGLLVGV